MEGAQGTYDKASNLASEDVISSMPDIVITSIMNRLTIRDAVRTGVLSRNWRLKWTLLTQLVFNTEISESFVTLEGPEGKKYYDGRVISRLLLLMKGPITKFSLVLPGDRILDVGDFNHWVLFLSTKGIKEFAIINFYGTISKLHTHLFSCLELTHLSLHNCSCHPPPAFHGFPNLLSLRLRDVYFESRNCGKVITGCPLLEILDVDISYHQFKINDIAKLKNLKKLTLLDLGTSKIKISSLFRLLGFLPKLEQLHLNLPFYKFVVGAVARKWTPATFQCLKTLILFGIDFCCGNMLFGMIWGSPNLKELYIEMHPSAGADELDVPPPELFCSDLGSSTLGRLQLQIVHIYDFRGSKNEVCLMKYLLACSPLMRSIAVYAIPSLASDEKLRAAMDLLKLHRASPVAQVDFY